MKIENQVCSVENAKRLVELGVNRKSFFLWSGDQSCLNKESGEQEVYYVLETEFGELPAYTVAELGEMLPLMAWSGIGTLDDGFFCEWQRGEHETCSENEADARALMLIWLFEKGHVNAGGINA